MSVDRCECFNVKIAELKEVADCFEEETFNVNSDYFWKAVRNGKKVLVLIN